MINPPTRELIEVLQQARMAEADAARAVNALAQRERLIRTWKLGRYRIVLTRQARHATPRLA